MHWISIHDTNTGMFIKIMLNLCTLIKYYLTLKIDAAMQLLCYLMRILLKMNEKGKKKSISF